MAILKIKDAGGNIHEILAIKGEGYVLTEADKIEIAEIVKSSVINPATTGSLTEEQVLELIRANMPTSAEEVDY